MGESTTQTSNLKPQTLLVILLYAALAVVYTWPLVLRLGSETPALLTVDRDQNLWNLWWFRYALLDLHHNPFSNPLVYWPDYQGGGVPLWFHTFQPLNGAAALVLQSLFGLVASYNLVALLGFVLAGYGAYLLVGYVSGNRLAGFVGGLAFTCYPLHLDNLMQGYLNLYSVEFLPYYLYALLRLRDAVEGAGRLLSRAALVWMLLAALFLTLISLLDWYHLVYALVITATLLLAYGWWARRQGGRWLAQQVGAVAAVGAVWLLVCAPILLPTLKELGSDTVWKQLPEEQRLLNSADLLSLFTPNPLLTVGGGFTGDILRGLPSHSRFCDVNMDVCMKRRSYLGFAALALALVGVVGGWRGRGRYWLFVTLLFIILALGPNLTIATNDTGVPLPFALFAQLPLMNIIRAPDRFFIPATLTLAVLIGLGFAWLLRRGAIARRVGYALVILMAIEFLPLPFATQPITAPRFFSQLAADGEPYALFELPLTGHFTADHTRTRNQIFHHKAISGGYLSRPLADNFGIMAVMQDWFADYTIGPDMVAGAVPTDTLLTMLTAYDFHYLILYKHEFGKPADYDHARQFVQSNIMPAPAFEDDEIVAYAVPAHPFTAPLLLPAEGWHKVEGGASGPRRWIEKARATLRIIVPRGQAGGYTLSFDAAAFAQPRRLVISKDGAEIGQQSVASDALKPYSFSFDLQEGTNFLILTVPDGYASPAALGLDKSDIRDLSITLGNLRLGR